MTGDEPEAGPERLPFKLPRCGRIPSKPCVNLTLETFVPVFGTKFDDDDPLTPENSWTEKLAFP